MQRSLALFALALLVTGSFGQSASGPNDRAFREARARFQKAVRGEDMAERRAAVQSLAETGVADALQDFVSELDKLDKAILKDDKALADIGRSRREIWDSIDEQAAKGRPISAGTANGAIEKERELQEEERKLALQRERAFAWRDMLIEGGGTLLVRCQERAPLIDRLAKEIEKAKSAEEALPRLRILEAHKDEIVRATIAGVLLTAKPEALRVAAADALGNQGFVNSHTALAKALEDEAWPVRVAAIRSLVRLNALDGVPALLKLAEQGDGRLREEVFMAFEDLSGKTFGSNITLWQEFWRDHAAKLAESLATLKDKEPARVLGALPSLEESGFLGGASALIERMGVGTKEGKPDFDDAALVGRIQEAIGRTISKGTAKLRERSALRLLLVPLAREASAERRVPLIAAAGFVQTAVVRERLLIYAGTQDLRRPGRTESFPAEDRKLLRLAAVKALGHQDSKDVVPLLRDLLEPGVKDADLQRAAILSLGQNRVRESIGALIRSGLLLDNQELKALALAQLEALTGQKHGPAFPPWNEWWKGAEAGFAFEGAPKTADQREAEEERGTGFYGIRTDSKHILYVIDRSGSMQEPDASGGGSRWSALQKELIQSIRSLKDDGTFNLVFYNHEYAAWKKGMVKSDAANRASAVKWIESLDATGNTNIFDPLAFALDQARAGQRPRYGEPIDTIFFLSDGQPNRGDIVDPEQILREVARRNESLKVRIHTIGIGQAHDAALMRRLAESNGGQYVAR